MNEEQIPATLKLVVEKDYNQQTIIINKIQINENNITFKTYYNHKDLLELLSFGNSEYVFDDLTTELNSYGYSILSNFSFVNTFRNLDLSKKENCFPLILKKI